MTQTSQTQILPPRIRPEGNHVLLSVNPASGQRSSRDRVERLVELLKLSGFATEVHGDLAEVAERANALHQAGELRVLVGVGGDGTAAELVNRTLSGVPLTLLPAGNENLLARYLHLDRQPESLARVIAEGALLRMDAGSANGRVFLIMVGCGFDAEVVRRVHGARRGHISNWDYFKQIVAAMRTYVYPRLLVDCGDGPNAETRAEKPHGLRWLFVCNLPYYGGGLRFTPQADGRDGLLDACGFRGGSLWSMVRYGLAVKLGYHARLADCRTWRTKRLRISAETEAYYQLDGDPGGMLPVDVEVLPGRLTVLVSARRAAELSRSEP